MAETGWDDPFGTRADPEQLRLARERRTMAELLLTRGHQKAAAIVAMSEYRSDCVDSWDGGQFEVVLSIPAAQFDAVDDDSRTALEQAARDVTGDKHFAGLGLEVQLLDPRPGWEQELFDRLFGERARSDLPGVVDGGS
jgi:hypothetical protein